jgi:GT2 family glycosyltransferase
MERAFKGGAVMMEGFRPKVTIILVNLNGYEDTRDCLESLERMCYPNFDVIVVDNGSSDDSSARLRRKFPNIKLFASKENLGISWGRNLGFEHALDNGADYILLLDNDTVVDPSFLTHLVQVGESDPGSGILGPKIFYAAEPKRIWYAGGVVKYGRGSCDHIGKDQLDQDGKFSRIEDTGFISGCASLVKSTVVREIGLLDEKLFIYWEDNDFCMRARNAGYRCVFVPTARVWHKVSRTCGRESAFTLYLATRNQLAWVAKHVPFPYKPTTLAFTVARKLVKMTLLSFKSRDSAAAIWEGIWDFLFGVYGPPRTKKPQSQMPSASANATD